MNAISEQLNSVTLFYGEGSSDKIYQCAIEPAGQRFVVKFAYGRRGATLQTGTKTNVPVDQARAESIFAQLVKEKRAKGYTEGGHEAPYQHTQKQVSGFTCQLLNPIEESAVGRFINDPAYGAQEKYDGQRRLLEKQGAAIHGINRKGLLSGLPSTLIQSAHRMPGDFVLDGECVGDVLHAFDLLVLNGEDLRPLPYRERYVSLMNLLAAYQSDHLIHHIKLAPVASKAPEKTALLASLKSARKEGIVFKRLESPYVPGRPNSGGSQFKHKFYKSLSAVVAKQNTQRSVEVRLLNDAGWVPAGNVTISVNFEVPPVGAVVEIRYLYAFKESGALFQPTYQGVRDDIEPTACTTQQLKYKAELSEEALIA